MKAKDKSNLIVFFGLFFIIRESGLKFLSDVG